MPWNHREARHIDAYPAEVGTNPLQSRMAATNSPSDGNANAIAVAVVEWQGKILIGPRPEGVPLAGYWEFPGGKVQAGETREAAARRECLEETGLLVDILAEYPCVLHEYAHGLLKLYFFACRCRSEAPEPRDPFRFVAASDLGAYRFPPANAELVAQLSRAPRAT